LFIEILAPAIKNIFLEKIQKYKFGLQKAKTKEQKKKLPSLWFLPNFRETQKKKDCSLVEPGLIVVVNCYCSGSRKQRGFL
jgi:hypothetical protein